MEFPELDFADEAACFQGLFDLVHPEGLRCPLCGRQEHIHIHGRHEHDSVPYYRCSGCDHKFSPWTGTVFEGTHRPPSDLWRIMQLLKAGIPHRRIAEESPPMARCSKPNVRAEVRRLGLTTRSDLLGLEV
jgi:hypothetical protein